METVTIKKSQLKNLLTDIIKPIIKERNKIYWTTEEIAKEIGLSSQTINKYTRLGIFQSYDLCQKDAKAIRYKLPEVLEAFKKVGYT